MCVSVSWVLLLFPVYTLWKCAWRGVVPSVLDAALFNFCEKGTGHLLQHWQILLRCLNNNYKYSYYFIGYLLAQLPSQLTHKFLLVPPSELEFKFDKRVARHRPCPQNPQTRFQAEPIRNSIIQVNFASVGVAQGLSDFFCFSFRSHFSPPLVSISSPTNGSDAFSQV